MTITCPECQNEFEQKEIDKSKWFECPFCGVTMEVRNAKDDGTPELTIVEEEK